jgi:type I restriction enzyme S subunit
MTNLPPGWLAVPIGRLCSLNNGRAFKPTEWSKKGLPIVRIQNLNDPEAKFNHYSGEFGDRYHLKGGELLFAWSGTPGTSFGAHVWRGKEALLNQHIFRVDFDEKVIEKRFFRDAINHKLHELIGKAHGGVGLRHVTKGNFEQTEITVPPRAEQTRIADRLESLLAKVRGCRERLERVPPNLKRFRDAVLEAAVSGRLTEEWRLRRNRERSGWKKTTFDAASEYITVGHVGKMSSEYVPVGVPFLRSLNVRPFRFDRTNLQFISQTFHQSLPKSSLRAGDVVVVRSGDPGQCCVIPHDLPEANCSDLVILRPLKILDPSYACIFINARQSQQFVRSEQVGVAQAHFNVGSMKKAPLDLPPLDEQHEIARRVDELFSMADALKQQCAAAIAREEKITPAILSKAFRGELVPQDPTDEPARELLQRIASSGAASARSNGPAAATESDRGNHGTYRR